MPEKVANRHPERIGELWQFGHIKATAASLDLRDLVLAQPNHLPQPRTTYARPLTGCRNPLPHLGGVPLGLFRLSAWLGEAERRVARQSFRHVAPPVHYQC